MTGITLELINDPIIYEIVDKGIRGGVSTIIHRFAKANNPGLKEYHPNVENSYIPYLDANNLYGWAISQPLPTDGFRFLNEYELIKLENGEYNLPFLVEVDFDYPDELHDLQCKVQKLIPHLGKRDKYVIQHVAYRQYLKYGLIPTKIHRAITFKESNWLAKYITFNTKLRQQSTTDAEKNFFKLMNNSCYGKTMEDVRNRVNVKL
jgi:hypothetical protein